MVWLNWPKDVKVWLDCQCMYW